MEDKTRCRLTAPEMAGLWSQYINDTMAVCIMRYFLEKVEDEEIRPIIAWTLDTAKENLFILQEIFAKEDFPYPLGFTEDDVHPTAASLFSDRFMLVYLRQMAMFAMMASSGALGFDTRPDVVSFRKRIYAKGVELNDKTRDLMLKQGILIKPPSLPVPQKVDFVKKQHFLAGFFKPRRSLTVIEISHLYLNIEFNALGKALMMGFAQTAQNAEVKQFLKRGKELAQKYIHTLSECLIKEDLPAPMSWDSDVLNSTGYVFSDKLIMFHVLAMISASIGNYGLAIGGSQRRDIGLKYMTMIPEAALFAEDGANIMIDHGWMEEPPQADDRDELMRS